MSDLYGVYGLKFDINQDGIWDEVVIRSKGSNSEPQFNVEIFLGEAKSQRSLGNRLPVYLLEKLQFDNPDGKNPKAPTFTVHDKMPTNPHQKLLGFGVQTSSQFNAGENFLEVSVKFYANVVEEGDMGKRAFKQVEVYSTSFQYYFPPNNQ